LVTTSVSDAFGRLRRVNEEVDDSGLNPPVVSEYGYDANDRLLSVGIGENMPDQFRFFKYSSAGFLEWSTEPERFTEYLSYNASGNLIREITKLAPNAIEEVATFYEYDDYSRLTSMGARSAVP